MLRLSNRNWRRPSAILSAVISVQNPFQCPGWGCQSLLLITSRSLAIHLHPKQCHSLRMECLLVEIKYVLCYRLVLASCQQQKQGMRIRSVGGIGGSSLLSISTWHSPGFSMWFSSVMMMFSMSFMERWSQKVSYRSLFSSSTVNFCMSHWRYTHNWTLTWTGPDGCNTANTHTHTHTHIQSNMETGHLHMHTHNT